LLDGSAELAAEVALGQSAPLTRSIYAGVYRAFCAYVGPDAGPDALTRAHVRAYRQALEQAGRSPATIAKHLSALRTLAAEFGVEGVHTVRGAKCRPRPTTRTHR
jgi:site-specific recombinase XerD